VRLWQICDFGLAKWKAYSQSHTSSRSKRAGTVTIIPPEIWSDINHPRTVKYDVYSFAILLWELIAEDEPFKNGKLGNRQLLLWRRYLSSDLILLISVQVFLRCWYKHWSSEGLSNWRRCLVCTKVILVTHVVYQLTPTRSHVPF